ncbi:MAG: beta-N-acetylglucosaminidase domain-containing protein [[Ruminococcus] torques]
MTQETIDYVSEKTGHKVCFWLNYPVNEHGKSGLYLGDITHLRPRWHNRTYRSCLKPFPLCTE